MTHINSIEILANRFIWSFVFVGLLILISGQKKYILSESKLIFSSFKKSLVLMIASLTMVCNWGVFIFAVNSGQIVATSMGYYINPMISVMFGVIFLKEKLNELQIVAVSLALLGICIMIYNFGQLPWISLVLAISFALYGLIKKQLQVSALTSIFLESLFITPIALIYEYHLSFKGGIYGHLELIDLLLLAGSGAVTAIPLLFFTASAKKLLLITIGFLQYIAPSLTLLLGVLLYKESFTLVHISAFSCIWVGIIIFSLSQIRNKKI
jgi:chloramphenicol-sensitive protein RarD